MLLLIGDSHLAYLTDADVRLLADACAADRVVRAAVPGATSTDLAGQLDAHAAEAPDVALVSVGSNDAAPTVTHVPVHAYRDALDSALQRLDGAHVVVLGPPPVDESPLGNDSDRTNDELARYVAAASEVAAERLASFVPTATVLAGADDDVLVEDGLHLSRYGYDTLLAVLAEVLRG